MKEEVNFETPDFLEKVSGEYGYIKSFENFEDLDVHPEPDFSESKWNIIPLSMIKFTKLFLRQGINVAKRKQGYDKYLEVSEDLLARPEIRKILSDSIKKSKEILSEHTLIKIVAGELNKEYLKKRFEIPAEPMLYALIVHKIVKIGKQDFCDL